MKRHAVAAAAASAATLLPSAVALSARQVLPSCSNATEPYDCAIHPSADYVTSNLTTSTPTLGSFDVNVTSDESCLDGCIGCFAEGVTSAKLRIKEVQDFGGTVAHYGCECGFEDGDGERVYAALCEDAGLYSGGETIGGSGLSRWGVWGGVVSALALGYGAL